MNASMNKLIGLKVLHKTLGKGSIKSFDRKGIIVVKFDNREKEARFLFPHVFDEKYLISCDDNDIDIKNIATQYRTNKKNFEALDRKIDTLMFFKDIGVKELLHFTDISNLRKILSSNRLNSRSAMKESGQLFYDAADVEVIEHTSEDIKKYVRFFYKEKTPTLYASEGIKNRHDNTTGHRPIPVALCFNLNIIFEDGVIFADGSGSSKHTNFRNKIEYAKDFEWETILNRGYHSKDALYDISNPEWSKQKIVNHRNAEFLYPKSSSLEYLEKIVFRSKVDMDRMILEYGKDDRYVVDEKYFSCENNYLKFWDITFSDDLLIEFIFNKENFFDYELKLKVVLESDLVEEMIIPHKEAYDSNLYSYRITPVRERLESIRRIEFYMDDILSAIWERKND